MKESDLYEPIARKFRKAGFKVQGEVCGCDIVAVRNEEIVVVELKKAFNVKLLYQAVRRLGVTPQVYVAIFRPEARQKMSFWQMIKSLARRLNLGVFVVDGDKISTLVEPAPFQSRPSTKQRQKVLKEFHGRKISENAGGVTGTKLNTAYLENAIHIAVLLKKHRKLTTARLQEFGTNDKTYNTLYRNVYGWFMRKDKGVYGLKPRISLQIRKQHQQIWDFYSKLVESGGDS
ncbi:MAG: DUF2161 family putative PD-(D/E)XK-type phosphodiesterase [bacterium]|nr:DUF2161 family putative PD-(D/E)XK-type phosphodiesterase [bacterium]